MTPLSLEDFTGAVDDVERTQYKILGGLQKAQDAFEQKRVYPTSVGSSSFTGRSSRF